MTILERMLVTARLGPRVARPLPTAPPRIRWPELMAYVSDRMNFVGWPRIRKEMRDRYTQKGAR